MVTQSIRTHREREIQRHKWIESEKAGRDLGEDAIYSWIHTHWKGYFRQRWLEHLQGKAFWNELRKDTFGILANRFEDQLPLFNHIIDCFSAGQENVHIVWWAVGTHHSIDDVFAILEAIDINGARVCNQLHEQWMQCRSEFSRAS